MKSIAPIHSFNFILFQGPGYSLDAVKKQIDDMVEKCAINTVNFIVMAGQEHTYSTEIQWKNNPRIPSDADLVALFRYAKEKGLQRIMKPMVNPMDGYWRAFIRFFDEDVPCEPKWRDWFANYTEYIRHYAVLSEQEGVEMLIAGCELVGTDHRDVEWRALIAEVRKVYAGLVTYNCDKYQEHNVKWWDACDVISSSGYYPVHDWPRQIARIQAVVEKFDKPFFFSEVGCPSTANSGNIPNDWTLVGKFPVDMDEQVKFFRIMFESCEPLSWHYGYSIWDWPCMVKPDYNPATDPGYAVIDKPAGDYIRSVFSK